MTAHPALSHASCPAWSQPTEDDSTGVDYLGTRAANLAMLRRLTGAYNNQVESARQHAILCWAAWRYLQNCRASNQDPTRKECRDFLDAIETIQLVGQRALGSRVGGSESGLGSRSLTRLGNGPVIELRFKAYGRSHATSALAAVQYGPSLRPESFGLMDARAGIWFPLGRGERLALALDPLLQRSPVYKQFTHFPTPTQMTLSDAIDLAQHGLVLGGRLPERPEREAYVEALFNLDGLAPDPGHERHLTLALVLELLRLLDRGPGVTVREIRRALLSGCLPDGSALGVPPHLAATAKRWQVFQLRQLQRYVLESWLCVVESSMLGSSVWSGELVESYVDALHSLEGPHDDLAILLDVSVGELVDTYLARRGVHDVLAWAAGTDEGSPWKLKSEISEAFEQLPVESAVPGVVNLTFGVLALCDTLVDDGRPHPFASIGGRRRISLLHFRNWWRRRADMSVRAALVEMLEELVLQQHVAVAVSRFDEEEPRRLRFTNDEAGWQLLPGTTPAVPRLTPDRISTLLRLMTDVALVDAISEEAFELTDAGRDVVDQVRVNCEGSGSADPVP